MGIAANRTVEVPFDLSAGFEGIEAFAREAAKLRDSGKADRVSMPVGTAAELAEVMEDILDGATIRARANEPRIPHDVVVAMHEGVHPVRAWRKYRGKTIPEIAGATGLPVGYLSEIETGKKPGSIDAYKALAKALDADISVLIPD